MSSASPPEYTGQTRPAPHGAEHLPWAYPSPSRHQPAESTSRKLPKPATCRPRSFSLPRRFPPPLALQVYFTPQPRPGFTLQGFSHRRSRTTFRWPLPSCRFTAPPAASLRRLRQEYGPASRAFLRAGVRNQTQGVSPRPTRSPPGFCLLRVLRLAAMQPPSRSLRS